MDKARGLRRNVSTAVFAGSLSAFLGGTGAQRISLRDKVSRVIAAEG